MTEANVFFRRRFLRKSGWFYQFAGAPVGPFATEQEARDTAFYDRHYG
jgi:hypothetical protein